MMDNDNSLNKRPTFKRALRNISITSIFITMMLIWLLLSVTSVLPLKQYAQKNLALTAATMTYSLEAAVVFADGPAATETLAALGQQGQFSTAEVRDKQQNILALHTSGPRRYFQQFHKPLALPRPHHSADSSQW